MKFKNIENKLTIERIIGEAFGEVSALFMSQECKGTEIVMPSRELEKITDETVARIKFNFNPTEDAITPINN